MRVKTAVYTSHQCAVSNYVLYVWIILKLTSDLSYSLLMIIANKWDRRCTGWLRALNVTALDWFHVFIWNRVSVTISQTPGPATAHCCLNKILHFRVKHLLLSADWSAIPIGPKKWYPCFNFAITSVMCTRYNHFFTGRTRNLWHIKVRLRLPPHLYSVITLPSKTHTANI